jgi:hypothetical protein
MTSHPSKSSQSSFHYLLDSGSSMRLSNLLKRKPSMKDTSEGGRLILMSERSLSDWLSDAGNTLDDRGLEYGDPRHNLLRIYKIARILGVQLRDPSELATIFIATKLSRMVESPEREDSYLDLIGYAAILGFTRFSTPEDWDDVESDSQY